MESYRSPATLYRTRRKELGLTQVELAQSSGVALPTLQMLEAGRSNPSIETLRLLGRELGLELEVKAKGCNWDRLIELGLPLARGPHASTRAPSSADLVRELRLALLENPPTARHAGALVGLLLALWEHYPGLFKRKFGRNPKATRLLEGIQGEHIKLKRLALGPLSEYL